MAEQTVSGAENLESQPSAFDELLAKSDMLNPATIEQPMAPKVNWQDNFVNPTNYIKDNTAGVSPNYPPSEVRAAQRSGAMGGSFEAILEKGMAKINGMSDMGSYAEPYAYDASPKGTFRDKYKAYGQETFNKIGFHPLIDNETWFNQNTTFGDDLKKWSTNSLWPMVSKGFMDPIKSYQSIMNGDGLFSSDEESARDYEYYNAIGASTKGGLGGFTVNLLNSASYSMGILLEGAVEGAIIGGMFGGANPTAGAIEGGTAFARKLGSLPKALMDATKATGKLMSSVKNYSNLAKAKDLYKSAGSSFGNFINPLHNTFEAYHQLKNTDNITNLARSSATAGALWHDMMAMNLSLSEGKLEGGFTRYQSYDKLYNEFMADPKNEGKPPSLEQQESMMRQASKGAWLNTTLNTGLIFLSNKIAFPSITNASFLKGAPKFAFGKVVGNVGKEFQILFDPGKKALDGVFTKQKVNFGNAIKSLAKPATYGKVGLNYFKANVVEGGQEVSQDVLQEAVQDYYVQSYKNKDARNYRYGAGLLGHAINKQWSSQGLETFLSGFLMGTILQAPGKIKDYATMGYNDYFKKDDKYQEYIQGREQVADDVVNELNTLYKSGEYFFDPRINNYANQALAANVVDDPDNHTTKEIKDTEFAAFQSAVLSTLQRGTFDMFLNHYKNYKQATPEDIEQAWNLKPGEGTKALERFDKALENAEKIRDRWNTAKTKMKFIANLDDYEEGSDEYKIAEIYNKAYNQSLYNYVFLHNSYDDNVNRLSKLYQNLSSLSVIKNSIFSDFVGIVDPNRLSQEIEMLKTEVESLESFGTTESLNEAARKRGLSELYSRFQEKQEELVDLFVNKSFLDNIVNEIKQEDPDLTDNQATIKAINKVIDEYDQGKSNEFLEYKEAFSDLLYGMADTQEKKLKLEQEIQDLGGIDVLFDELLDTHILKNENARLIQYVNTLANPREFYEHLMRNFKFMKDLYDNREETIKEIVNGEIEAIENNTLLNTLADQGIYIDLEEFAKWVENKRYLPEEFFDVKNKKVITKGSVLYQDILDIFFKAAKLSENKPAGDPLTQKQLLDKRLEGLENDRGEALQKEYENYVELFKRKYGLTPEEYEMNEAERVAGEELTDEEKEELDKEKNLLIKAAEGLSSDDYVRVQASAEVVAEELFSKKDQDPIEFFDQQTEILKADDASKRQIFELSQTYDVSDIEDQQEQVNTQIDSALKATIYGQAVSARLDEINIELNKKPAAPTIDVENTKEYLAYQEAIQAINDKYDALVSEVKESFREKGVDENTPDEYTTKTDFEDFDLEYQEEITNLFDQYLVDVIGEPIDIKTKDPLEYERLRTNWLEQQSSLIGKFNEQAKQAALDKARKLAEPPQLKFIDVKINAQTTTYTIASLINRFKKFLEDGEYTDPKSNKVMQLTPQDIQNINDDIEALNGYLNARVSASAPRNIAEQTIQIIQENIINKQDELVDILDENGNVIGRTFKDRGPDDPVPDRTTKVAEEVENSLKEKDSFEYSPIKPKVDDEGNVLASPVERLYNQFFNDPEIVPEDRIRLFMDAFKREVFRGWKEFKYPEKLEAVENSLKTVGTYEDLRKTIANYAFKESSDAGDYVDGLIRIFLTPNAANASNFSEFSYDSTVQLKGRDIKISNIMSRKAFDKMFAPVTPSSPGGIVTKFRLGVVDGTYMILSENVKLFDKTLRGGKGVTGEIDLLLVREDGSVAIVDIKTKSLKERKGKLVSGWKDFGNPTAKYESSTYFRGQQSIYGYQFYNSTAITPDLKLMPFDMLLSKDKIGYIEDIDLAEIVPDGQDTIDLEYLPEIENFGITKIQPDIKAPIIQEEVSTEKEEGIPESEPTMNKLKDNLNKAVIYNGRSGKLVRMPDGNFGVEVTINNDITTLQLTLDALQANLDIEKQYGTEESIADLEKDIKRISDAINSSTGITEIFPLQQDLKNVSNGDVSFDKVGLQLVIPIQEVGQLSTVNGQVINASFSNKEETIASINGVRYNVLRDASGNITTLSYMINDEAISKLNKQIGDLTAKIGNLKNSVSIEDPGVNQDNLISRIADLQNQLKNLTGKKTSLVDSNKRMYLYGENANDYIFALNRLPNNFQRLTRENTKAQETQDLKSISNLSLSTAIADTITEILAEGYPEELDRLFDGTFDYKFKAKPKINKWIDNSIEKLYTLGYSVINRGDLIDDIQNQINALLDLKNDLTLIKLTRERKIKNYAEVRKIFTEGQRVQDGTSVPQNERTTRKQTERVPRPATREEVQDLVKQAREEILTDVFQESVVSEEVSTLSENMLDDIGTIENIAKLSTIDLIYQEAFLKAQERGEDATELTKAYKKRLEELKIINVVSNVEIGEYLISKNPIFTDISGEIVQVVDIFDVYDQESSFPAGTQSTVTLRNIKTGEVREFTDNVFSENFEKTTMEATQPEPEVELTPIDIEDSKESKDTIDELIKNGQDAIAEAKEKAKKSDSQSSWGKLGINSKLC